jgi:hypothetical protein
LTRLRIALEQYSMRRAYQAHIRAADECGCGCESDERFPEPTEVAGFDGGCDGGAEPVQSAGVMFDCGQAFL